MTVAENLMIALAIANNRGTDALSLMDTPDLRLKLDEVLKRYNLEPQKDATVSALAQGVRKLLDIAMAVVSKPRILLLDEPTSGISVEEKFDFMDIVMGALKEDGVTVLFVEHDMEIVERYVSRVLAFYQGEIIADMPPKKALADKKVQEFVIGKEYHKKKK
jgi:branched-chain amino acid transport system ATP-binding protein